MPTPGSCTLNSTPSGRSAHAHVDRAAARRELDRVADQVVQHLLEVVAVGRRRQRRSASASTRDLVLRWSSSASARRPRATSCAQVHALEVQNSSLPDSIRETSSSSSTSRPSRPVCEFEQLQPIEVRALSRRSTLGRRRALFEPAPHPPLQHLGEPRDRRQRRLQLVRGHRQEPRLQPVELCPAPRVSSASNVRRLQARPSPRRRAAAGRDSARGSSRWPLRARPTRALQLHAELAALDAARDHRAQLVHVARLDQVVVRALAQRLDRRFERGVAGQDDRHRVRLRRGSTSLTMLSPSMSSSRRSVSTRSNVVLAQLARARRRPRRSGHVVAVHLQDGAHRHGDALLVVDDRAAYPLAMLAPGAR